MPPGAAHGLARVAAVIPAVLLVLFIGLLWLLGLPCDRERHRYVTDLQPAGDEAGHRAAMGAAFDGVR